MAVSNIQEKQFVGGSIGREEFVYTVLYQCTSDSLDGPDTVRRDPFFRLGKSYSFGNDSNPSARLIRVSPKLYSENNRTYWLVECEYSTATKESEPGDGPGSGGSTDTPNEVNPAEPESVELRFVRVSELANNAKYLRTISRTERGDETGYDRLGGPDGISAYVGPPLNSALQVIDPSPRIDRTLCVIRVNVPAFAQYNLINVINTVGKINKAVYTIQTPGKDKIRLTYPARTLRLIDATHEPINWINNGYVMFSLDFLYDEQGHTLKLSDEGTVVKNDLAEPETTGTDSGRLPYSHSIATKLETIKDEGGATIATPTLLDGMGGIKTANGIVYLQEYLETPTVEADFTKLPRIF